MKKNIAITLSVFLIVVSALVIFGTQFFSGGNNPPDLIMFVLMVIIGGSAETITFFIFKKKILQSFPLVIALVLAACGTYFFLTSEAWANATIMDLICGYHSPMLGTIVSLVLMLKHSNK